MPTLPDNFIASTTAMMTSFLSNFSPYIYLMLGLLGGLLVIEAIVYMIKR